ncbi:F-box domain-containing protein [Mycena indigotica]|uniref:F-box domain-containing protein n=1 Tax=Mycena indigotica TaxID=2126181 RepID=A0A8H6SMC5_9AGAR|nr:F-box domain-containing protein [Mycena indigotica]KAF7301462.1 F-box domain-containing protein [Mycena indigotica]
MSLPPELLDYVCGFVATRDLALVARCSITLYPIALRSLYRQITISDASTQSIVHTLAHRRDIAAFVRKFSVADVSLCPHELAAALTNMAATLVSLDIWVEGVESWIFSTGLMSPQLEHLGTSIPFDPHVAGFCAGAPSLETVHFASEPVDFCVDACVFPRLATFTGSAKAAVAIVPGRPIESVFITSGDLSEDLVPVLARSTSQLSVLSTTTNSLPVSLLGGLGRHLPQLRYLQINSTRDLATPPTTIFYEQVADALALFPILESFELSGIYWPSQVYQQEQKRVWQSQPLHAEELDAPEDMDEFGFLW